MEGSSQILYIRQIIKKNYYASVFSCEQDTPDINSIHSDKPFAIKISIIRKWLTMIGRNKSKDLMAFLALY
jgi:hypothetical protein